MDDQNGQHGNNSGRPAHHQLKRPPAMGELRRTAEAQALTLRAELRAALTLDGVGLERVASEARLRLPELEAFLAGSALNPRWQAKLEAWLAQRE
ncbi:MAG: hypothetical protein ACHQ4H_18370 [Ktedonobacterales bacterium]